MIFQPAWLCKKTNFIDFIPKKSNLNSCRIFYSQWGMKKHVRQWWAVHDTPEFGHFIVTGTYTPDAWDGKAEGISNVRLLHSGIANFYTYFKDHKTLGEYWSHNWKID